MILSFFSPPRAGELLYSTLARHAACRGYASPKAVMHELFGRSSNRATTDLPNNLSALFDRLPLCEGERAAELMGRHTHLRYYTAYQSPERREAACAAMLGPSGNLHVVLGLAAFRTARPTHLQFCSDCLTAMELEHGCPHWRVDHQLPGVLVCADHGRRLRRSLVRMSSVGRHEFVLASRRACPVDAEPVTGALKGWELDMAMSLAQRSEALLNSSPPPLRWPPWQEYRSRLATLGLMRGPHKADQAGLDSGFRDYFGDLLDRFQGAELSGPETWLNSIVRSKAKAHPPLHHLMLGMFLDAAAGHESSERGGEISREDRGRNVQGKRPRNWGQIDVRYAASIREGARRLSRLLPPVRITAAAIEQGLKGRDWLSKRRGKLPVSVRTMAEVVESTEAFRVRRLEWQVACCTDAGIFDPWVILRRAGLPHAHVDLVRAKLAAATSNSTAAAA